MCEKICSSCKICKPFLEFHKNKKGKDGLRSICKECTKIYSHNYHLIHIEKHKINNKNYALNNKEKIKAKNRLYCLKNRELINKKRQNKLQTDPLYKLSASIRNLISASFRRKYFKKNSKTSNILGCSLEYFKSYIESQFEPWMTWENYGNSKNNIYELNKTWDLDHIIPLASAKNLEEIIKLNHYTNFQPLCSYTNRNIKRGKIN